jgi:hypothetical protein
MSTRRSSIRGKGAEILFGGPPVINTKPRPADPALALVKPSVLRASARTTAPDELTGEPGDSSATQSLLQGAERSKAEEEAALREEALAGESRAWATEGESSGELDETSLQSQEAADSAAPASPAGATLDERGLATTESYLQPPPPEIVDDVLPPRPERMVFDLEDKEEVAADIQSPDEEVELAGLPAGGLTREEEDELASRYGQARIQNLAAEIDRLYEQVRSEVGASKEISTWCFNLLLQAKDIVLRYDVARLSKAEYNLEQVRARLERAAESQSWARKHAWWITGWGFFWGVIFLGSLVVLSLGWLGQIAPQTSARQAYVDPAIFLQAMVWGGIGGVVAIWYSLFKHVSNRDFDIQYGLSYVTKPFFGLILGGTVYMVVQLLILSLGISPLLLPEGLANSTIAPWLIYLMAWVCGFNEARIFGLVDGVMKRTLTGQEATSTT